MTTITSSPNLYACKKHPETHGSRGFKPRLQAAVNALIKQHLSEDHFFAYDLNPGPITLYARKGDRIAFEQGPRIFLYDLIGRNIMWSCKTASPEGYFLSSLEIFNKNQVRGLYKKTNLRARTTDLYITIFAAGKQIASTPLRSVVSPEHHLNTHKRHLFYRENQTVQVIDQNAQSISLISLDHFHWNYSRSYLSRNFYVVTSYGEPYENRSAQAFVFNRTTEQKMIFNLHESNKSIAISCAYMHKNHLICGVHHYTSLLFQCQRPTIHVLDLITGETSEKYDLGQQSGFIKTCVANENWIVYVTGGGMNQLSCINRQSKQQTKLSSYGPSYIDAIELSLSEDYLYVCHTTQIQQYFRVVDLESKTVINEIRFQHQMHDRVDFAKGKLVISNPNDPTRPAFYIEDYLNPEPISSKESIATPRRIER